jgi:hypothetical protein
MRDMSAGSCEMSAPHKVRNFIHMFVAMLQSYHWAGSSEPKVARDIFINGTQLSSRDTPGRFL